MDERTHASFFSGVGGLDLGLERAGWRTVSFSEIDPYASAVLAERWPGVPNLGDIVGLAADDNEAQAGQIVAFNPYRTLERDGSVTSGYAERDVVDALHGPTGNKEPLFVGGTVSADPLLPLGLDSHRYRCCGNGVVADVAYWIGLRLASLKASAA